MFRLACCRRFLNGFNINDFFVPSHGIVVRRLLCSAGVLTVAVRSGKYERTLNTCSGLWSLSGFVRGPQLGLLASEWFAGGE